MAAISFREDELIQSLETLGILPEKVACIVKFLPDAQIHNKSASVQVMAWCQLSENPLPKPMSTSTYI